ITLERSLPFRQQNPAQGRAAPKQNRRYCSVIASCPNLSARDSPVAAKTAQTAETSGHNSFVDVSAVSAVSAAHKRALTCQRRTGLPPLGLDGFTASGRNQPDLVSASTRLSV